MHADHIDVTTTNHHMWVAAGGCCVFVSRVHTCSCYVVQLACMLPNH